MLIQNESPAPAPAAVSGTSQKLLQLLRKRLRQLARVTFVLAIGLALAATALAIWWLTSLNGLPDIGDPFDVAAFRAFSIPDDQNAFTFLRRANEKLTPMPGGTDSRRRPRWSPGPMRTRSCGSGSRRIARRSSCSCKVPDVRRDLPTAGEPALGYSVDMVNAYLVLLSLLEGGQATESVATWRAPGTAIARSSAWRLTPGGGGAFGSDRISTHIATAGPAATARDLGGRSQDDDPPAS